MGATIAPKIIPNLNHSLFNGVNNFEFINPKIKKTIEIITNQILIGSPYVKGHKLTTKKAMKKTTPKFRFELIFTLFITLLFYIKLLTNQIGKTRNLLPIIFWHIHY